MSMMKSSTKSTAAEKSPVVKTGWLDAYGTLAELPLQQGQLGVDGGLLDVECGQRLRLAWLNGGDAKVRLPLNFGVLSPGCHAAFLR
jgi:hypothetical protein